MPSRKALRLILFAATLLFVGPAAFAQTFSLEISGMQGESTLQLHPNTIGASAFSLSCTNSGSGPVFGDLNVAISMDKATPPLFLAMAGQTNLAAVNLYATKAGNSPYDYYIIKLTNAKVSSISQNGSPASVPAETVTFRYQKIEIDYIAQAPTGQPLPPVVMRWDLTTNQPF
jgi:type VI secretion system Hcp family effector